MFGQIPQSTVQTLGAGFRVNVNHPTHARPWRIDSIRRKNDLTIPCNYLPECVAHPACDSRFSKFSISTVIVFISERPQQFRRWP